MIFLARALDAKSLLTTGRASAKHAVMPKKPRLLKGKKD